MWVAAVVLEQLMALCEPVHWLYDTLAAHHWVHTALERVPIDVGYSERRWWRLLMIALALLPSFAGFTFPYELDDETTVVFQISSACLAYIIKVYYFDVVDDGEKIEMSQQEGRAVRHGLQFQTASRWRANLWLWCPP